MADVWLHGWVRFKKQSKRNCPLSIFCLFLQHSDPAIQIDGKTRGHPTHLWIQQRKVSNAFAWGTSVLVWQREPWAVQNAQQPSGFLHNL